MIELTNLSKYLGSFKLQDITFTLPPGYICGLIGPNGAGKTTLLHLILGLYRPDGGQIRIQGMEYETMEQEIRRMTGTVLMEDLFEDGMTLRQNGDEYGRYFRDYDKNILEEYLGRFRLDGSRKYKSLSKGERLKFQLAFALSHDAKLLVLDEPTGNFDPQFRREFFLILKEFIADGTRSVILATHLTDELDQWADYILYLEKGTELFGGDIETLRDSFRLLTGEMYKLKLLRAEEVIHIEKGTYGCRALVKHRHSRTYDPELTVTIPTIAELMYFITKRGNSSCFRRQ